MQIKKNKAIVKYHNGASTLFIDESPYFLSAPYLFKAPYEEFFEGKHGIYMIHDLAIPVSDDGIVNIDAASSAADDLIAREPTAKIIVRAFPPSPAWWLNKHPEEAMKFDTNVCLLEGYNNYSDASWASEVWLDATCAWYREFCEKLEQKYSNNIIGYQFAVGTCGENNPLGACTHDGRWFCSDFSLPMVLYFRNWLQKKYRKNYTLQKAWGESAVTFHNASVPKRIERLKSDWFTFRNPKRAQVADYYEAFADCVQNMVIRICESIKLATNNRCITGCHLGAFLDNGYHGFLYNQMSINKFSKALDHHAVDMFTSPPSYINREPGGDSTSMMPVGSYTLRNKLIFQDQDTRTHTVSESYRENFSLGVIAKNINETVGQLKRDVAQMIIRGYGCWWHPIVPNIYKSPAIGKTLGKLTEIGQRSLSFERGTADGIAMIVDERSNFHQSCTNRLLYPMLYKQRQFYWGRSGCAWNVHLLQDLQHPNFKLPKMLCFLNIFYLSDKDVEGIKKYLKNSGTTVVWFYAPGIQSPNGFEIDRMKKLTGFDIRSINIEALPRITILDTKHDITKGSIKNSSSIESNIPFSFGTGEMGNDEISAGIGPLFYVRPDKDCTVLGELDAIQKPAFCIREMEGWTSIYIGAPMINQHLLANIARLAGVHIYNETNDVILPGKKFISIHATSDGEKKIILPEASDVYEPYEERVIGTQLLEINDFLKKYETKLYFLGSKEEYQSNLH